jgi:dihydroorotate dehydrogenase (NAD+) catalytic subunit
VDVDLTVELGAATPRPLTLRNPVMTAAGTFGYGVEQARLVDLARLGAVVTKSTTLRPWRGAPLPRWVETPSGVLNAIGLQNPGVSRVLREYGPRWATLAAPVVVSVAGETLEEYVAVAHRLEEAEHVAAVELNVSCPNTRAGGVHFGSDPRQAAEVTAAVRAVTTLPLVVKLSPNASDLPGIACAVEAAGADAVSLVNTLTGLVIDTGARKPLLGNVTGGLSGPAIRPVAVRMVWEVAQVVRAPVIGLGGIVCADDALQFLLAGASAVQVGSAGFARPGRISEVADGIEGWMRREGVRALGEIVGCALPPRRE